MKKGPKYGIKQVWKSFEIDENNYIHTLTITLPYVEVGIWANIYNPSVINLPPEVMFSDEWYTEFGYHIGEFDFGSVSLYELETGRYLDLDMPGTDRIENKSYMCALHLTSGFSDRVHGVHLERAHFADDLKVYLRCHVDAGLTDREIIWPAEFEYAGDSGTHIDVWIKLDFSYFHVFSIEKTVIGLNGIPDAASCGVSWYNKDDVFGDGTVSFDPETGTLHLRGDVGKLRLTRWAGTEPPRISIDDDVNVDNLYLEGDGYSKVIIGGTGTLHLNTLQNGGHKKIVFSNCSAYIRNWDDNTLVELDSTSLSGPENAYINNFGKVMDENGDWVKEDVVFRRYFPKNEDSGDVGTIHWHYDFVIKTFTVSGSGRFERLAPYDKYLDVMEYFRTETGVTELGDDMVKAFKGKIKE